MFLGGGARAFVPADNPYNIEGLRTDGRDLIQAWRVRYGVRAKFVQIKKELAQITPKKIPAPYSVYLRIVT